MALAASPPVISALAGKPPVAHGGSHPIFVHGELSELLNLQNVGGEAKAYQIRQFLRLVERYNLIMEDSP